MKRINKTLILTIIDTSKLMVNNTLDFLRDIYSNPNMLDIRHAKFILKNK